MDLRAPMLLGSEDIEPLPDAERLVGVVSGQLWKPTLQLPV